MIDLGFKMRDCKTRLLKVKLNYGHLLASCFYSLVFIVVDVKEVYVLLSQLSIESELFLL